MAASACPGGDVALVLSKARPASLVPGRSKVSKKFLLYLCVSTISWSMGNWESAGYQQRGKENSPVLDAYYVSGSARGI